MHEQVNITSIGGGFCSDLLWNDNSIFDAEIVIIMTIHNQQEMVKTALKSAIMQKGSISYAILLINDSSIDNWIKSLGNLLHNPKILLAQGHAGKAWKVRNLAHKIIYDYFPKYSWICRMDADDSFESDHVIMDIYHFIQNHKPDALWALPGNKLKIEGKIIDRVNLPNPNLSNQDILLEQLKRLKNSDKTAELPSCNIWIHRTLRLWYPEIESAEDHWLVTKILIYYPYQGLILPEIFHSVYSLSGVITKNNRNTDIFRKSRELLYYSAYYWIYNTILDHDYPICLGWGGEGVVWLENGKVTKKFYPKTISDKQVQWLQKNIPRNNKYLISPDWNRVNQQWQAVYTYTETDPAKTVTRVALSNFIQFIFKSNIVCVNIIRKNFRLQSGNLLFIDIGQHIYPFEIRYFRDICARLYLLFVLNYSDTQLNQVTLKIQNNIEELQKIDGFEDFYKRELLLFFYSQGFLSKPFRYIPIKFHYSNISLLIKACAMDYNFIEQAIHHIIHQIGSHEVFFEIILFIDSKQENFLRQYREPNLSKTIEIAQKLKSEKLVDRILISPNEDEYAIITEINRNWFGIDCRTTHSISNIPVFSQLWAFEQITTRYVLQLDLDVMIHRTNYEYNILRDMLDAIQEEDVFSVGYNICQKQTTSFKTYDAPSGNFVPEVRFGLLDLERIKHNRPFPNSSIDGKLELSWYRSIEKYQKEKGWRSLRGGDPNTYYIHPPNVSKNNHAFMNKVLDLIEQGYVPSNQQLKWDLIGTDADWNYPVRIERFITVIVIQEPNMHWGQGCLNSLFQQKDVDLGVIIINTTRSFKFRYWLLDYIKPHREKITLIQSDSILNSEKSLKNILTSLVKNPKSFLIWLKPNEILFHDAVFKAVETRIRESTEFIAIGIFYSKVPLIGISTPSQEYYSEQDFFSFYKGNLIRGCSINDLDLFPMLIEHKELSDFPKEFFDSRKILVISEYCIFNPFSSPDFNTNLISTQKDLRPSIYIPNLKRIEIDITYQCNLRCIGCSRSCAQAPEMFHMSIDTIAQFLDETESRGIEWESVHVLGGEPTLHPQFVEIITMLQNRLEKISPKTDLKVISNGNGSFVRNQIEKIPKCWLYATSFKENSVNEYFEPFNLAPIDIPSWKQQDFRKGCWITQDCGIGLTPFGYFHCAIAGGIERIMDLGNGFSQIPTHPWEFLDMMNKYCRYCGFFLNDHYYSRQEQLKLGRSPEIMSTTWENAYREWKVRKIKM